MKESWMSEIPGSEGWSAVEEIRYGWSGERKYRITAANGEKLLLRAADGGRYEAMRLTHEAMLPVNDLHINASRAIDCGKSADGSRAWALLSYIEGEPLDKAIPTLSNAKQYELGLQAGETLRKIHSIPAPDAQPDWEERFNKKIDRKREKYMADGCEMPMDTEVFAFIDACRPLLRGRQQTLQHGDYHIGNMVLDGESLGVIDFNRLDWGDPYEEFNRIPWCAQAAPEFARGRVDGYFGGKPVPEEFFRLMALYIANNEISTVSWAIAFGEEEMRTAKKQYADMLEWYEGFTRIVPTWYAK